MSNTEELIRNPEEFWNTRHQSTDEWRSGGDKGLSIASNKSFYFHRLGLLVSLMDEFQFNDRLRILDAGCGKGWLSDLLSSIGHEVTGIDTSQTAIDICRRHRSGRFVRVPLHDFSDVAGFDVIVLLDVMFHILDDLIWERSLRNLAANLRSNGIMIIADTPVTTRQISGNYIVYRPLTQYEKVLTPSGARLVGTRAYQFADNHNTLMTFKSA